MNLNIEGQTLSRICFDHAVSFLMSSGGEIRVETGATFRAPHTAELHFEPESPGSASVALLQLLQRTVTRAEAFDDGLLVLEFDSGAKLTVEPHDSYESWGFVGESGARVISIPGGGITTWE